MFATVLVYNCSSAVSGLAKVAKGRANINAAMVRAARSCLTSVNPMLRFVFHRLLCSKVLAWLTTSAIAAVTTEGRSS